MGRETGRFGRTDRLRRPREFAAVNRRGWRTAGPAFVVLGAQRRAGEVRDPRVRLGITVSRKVGPAVVRNRVKRRVREWFRRSRAGLAPDLDLVVIARRPAAGLSGPEVGTMLSELLPRRSLAR